LICVEWSKAGGIAGRGVLIDYFAYAKRHNIQYQIPGRWAITSKDIEAIAKEQNLESRYGDIEGAQARNEDQEDQSCIVGILKPGYVRAWSHVLALLPLLLLFGEAVVFSASNPSKYAFTIS
jgi:hypothetical protein